MKLLSVVTAVALAVVSLGAVAASVGIVSYTCDNGKRLSALHEFDRQGKAVNVAINVAGTQANLTVSKKQSDSTGTTFTNRRSYSLSADYIDESIHTTSNVVGSTASGSRFIMENRSPVSS